MDKVKAMRAGGKKLSVIFGETLKEIKPGVSLAKVNQKAEDLLAKEGLKASFKTVRNYQWASCLNLNEGVVHGIPDQKIIKVGDLVSLDLGLIFKGWHTDMAYTIEVETDRHSEFLKAGKEALKQAILQARVGNRVGHISAQIEKTIKGSGYSVVSQLTGHGVGKTLHESPNIPGVLRGGRENTLELKKEQSIAIEVIYAQGEEGIEVGSDGWTISTQDGKMGALFEKTILVGENQAEELTSFIK